MHAAEVNVPDAGPVRGPLELTGRQRVLHEALSERTSALASMYLGALSVLVQTDNPDRIALCAHGMRELFEKLPLHLGLPVPKPEQTLNSRVNNLRDQWHRARKAAKCTKAGQWDGEIGLGLRKTLAKIDQFFEEHAEAAPKRKAQVGSLIERLDPAQRPLPDPVKQLRVDELTVYRDYFQGIAHHNPNADVAAFDSMMERSEVFLVDQLRPRTFDDHRAIEAMIADAENT